MSNLNPAQFGQYNYSVSRPESPTAYGKAKEGPWTPQGKFSQLPTKGMRRKGRVKN